MLHIRQQRHPASEGINAHGDRLECCAESSSEADSQDEDGSQDSLAHDGNQNARGITSSGCLNLPSDGGNNGGRGGDSYSSFEEDAEDIKPIPRRARK